MSETLATAVKKTTTLLSNYYSHQGLENVGNSTRYTKLGVVVITVVLREFNEIISHKFFMPMPAYMGE